MLTQLPVRLGTVVTFNFEGIWLLDKNPNKKLIIIKTEDNLYSLKFHSNIGDWEGVGYRTENQLLSIFKYKNLNQNGYITFKILKKDKISYQSIETSGKKRAKGYYYRINSVRKIL